MKSYLIIFILASGIGNLDVSKGSNLLVTDKLQNDSVNVKSFGAKGDGVTDDTRAINNAVKAANKIYFPSGTYMIMATGTSKIGRDRTGRNGGIIVGSNKKLILSPRAILKAIPGNRIGYSIINIDSSVNVTISGGQLLGDRAKHLGTTGEWGHGIFIRSSKNVKIYGVKISDCWGDGIYLGTDSRNAYNDHIDIDNVVCYNNRRQGLTIGPAHNVRITNSEFSKTNGTPPQSGIDIEEDQGYPHAKYVYINNCKFIDNFSIGIVIGGSAENVTISNNDIQLISSEGIGISLSNRAATNTVDISGNKITLVKGNGIYIAESVPISNLTITNNIIKGSNGNWGTAIRIDNGSGAVIKGNYIADIKYGILAGPSAVTNAISTNSFKNVSLGNKNQ